MRCSPVTLLQLAGITLLASCTSVMVPEKVKVGPKIGLESEADQFSASSPVKVTAAPGSLQDVSEGGLVTNQADFGVWNKYFADQLAVNLKIRKVEVSDSADTTVVVKITRLKMDMTGGAKSQDTADLAVELSAGDWKSTYAGDAKGNGPHTALGEAMRIVMIKILADGGFLGAIGASH